MINRFSLIFLVLLFSSNLLTSQQDLTEILSGLDVTVKDKGDDIIEDTYTLIRPRMSGLSPNQKTNLAELLTSMKGARLSLNPYYKIFFLAYVKSANADLPDGTYDQWIEVLQSMLADGQSNRANKVKAFLEFSKK